MSRAVLGLDVGGANLKAAWYNRGDPPAISSAGSTPFPLWRGPGDLARELKGLIGWYRGPRIDLFAITMTGELCDCYTSKRQGVCAILDAVEEAAPSRVPVWVWGNQGRFVNSPAARAHPLTIASANWLALATFAARLAAPDRPALLIDIGSTTTDLIPICEGRPVPQGRSDPDRLRSGELVYTGVRRTPVCALIQEGVAAELFATTLDAYLVLGRIPEISPLPDIDFPYLTADGQPPTREAAHLRLARMLGADLETSRPEDRLQLAREVAARQVELIGTALGRVLGRMPALPDTVILAGEGEFLARTVLVEHGLGGCKVISLRDALGEEVSKAACAHAVAVLAAEEEGDRA